MKLNISFFLIRPPVTAAHQIGAGDNPHKVFPTEPDDLIPIRRDKISYQRYR